MSARKAVSNRAAAKSSATRPPTIYDREKYFDVKLSQNECSEIQNRIIAEMGLKRPSAGISRTFDLLHAAETEIMNALNMYPVPWDWQHIHVCRQLEIDYKSFAKNVPKLPIEPFYRFVEPLFPHFKAAKNKMQLSIQTQHAHLAFIDWIDQVCPENGCKKSSHGYGCWDTFEKVDYEQAAKRICAHNAARPKFTPLRLVHSRD